MLTVCAQITPAAGASRAAPSPLAGRAGLTPQRLAHAKAFSLYSGDSAPQQPQGPFSFFPRPAAEAAKATAAAAKKAAAGAAKSLAEELTADEDQQLLQPLGKQRFRSALEQVRPLLLPAVQGKAGRRNAFLICTVGWMVPPTLRTLIAGFLPTRLPACRCPTSLTRAPSTANKRLTARLAPPGQGPRFATPKPAQTFVPRTATANESLD
jgi:hypothetical protein